MKRHLTIEELESLRLKTSLSLAQGMMCWFKTKSLGNRCIPASIVNWQFKSIWKRYHRLKRIENKIRAAEYN